MPTAPLSLLDNIRLSNGADGLRNYYRSQLLHNKSTALELLNGSNIQFGTLYLLKRDIPEADRDSLRPLYQKSLKIAAKLAVSKSAKLEKAMRAGNDDTASILRWMLQTGYIEEDPDNDYWRLMEKVAALLTKSFRDTSVLTEISEMIFARNRKRKLIHELVWAFFEARSPESLFLIAEQLNSHNMMDVQLARKLLCFIPEIENLPDVSGAIYYNRAVHWLQENMPFLYYTGESLHLCNSPRHYAVSWTAKYLCRSVSVENGEPILPLNETEKELAIGFSKLEEPLQQQLANFSYLLYRRNVYQWNTLTRLSLNDQTNLAAHWTGGSK